MDIDDVICLDSRRLSVAREVTGVSLLCTGSRSSLEWFVSPTLPSARLQLENPPCLLGLTSINIQYVAPSLPSHIKLRLLLLLPLLQPSSFESCSMWFLDPSGVGLSAMQDPIAVGSSLASVSSMRNGSPNHLSRSRSHHSQCVTPSCLTN